ncbi:hypothetical protein [Leclercia sp.]|uniref:hypothetical protein n=1 Tax=Leclercia sp. TaxID=1898428 RepID=UPI0028B11553|nr:hypothetical protein [Leclercia sp.]
MTKFTKERLISEIEMLEHFAGNVKWISEKGEQSLLFAVDAMRQLLDGMDQEPVADVVAWSSPTEERTCDIRWRRHDVDPGPLYAVPPPAPVVPNKMTIETLPEEIKQLPIVTALIWMEGWNASFAAAPRGKVENAESPTSIQSLRALDLLPINVESTSSMSNGLVAVPVEPTENMIIAGFEAELREEFRDPEAWKTFEAMSGCEQAAHRAKLCWAAMIAAAPQQEVK